MRRPDQWRAEAIGVKHHFAHQKAEPVTVTARGGQDINADPAVMATSTAEDQEVGEEDKKRKKDDIDDLFEGVVDKKKKKSKKERS